MISMAGILWLAVGAASAGDVPLSWNADGAGDEGLGTDEGAPGLSTGDVPRGEVVGGERAEEGAWEDAVGIVFNGSYVGCTGTLVHPRVVLTAGHCVGNITDVLVGSTNWFQDGGEIIAVQRVFEYPNSQRTYDAAVLLLEKRSSYTPRVIATDCITDRYLVDGAEVAVVGFGNTDESGQRSTSALHEGFTYIQDADGDQARVDGIYTGFQSEVSPGGELGAGGNGVDACFGDSGGPLYLLTPEGDFLAGITSRAYAGVSQRYPCRDGGVYVRPDAIMKWAEQSTGIKLEHPDCNAAPSAAAEPLVAGPDGGETVIVATDPDAFNDGFTYEVVQPPAYGTVAIDADGVVSYQPDGSPQDDSFVVAVRDGGSPWRASGPESTELTIEVIGSACGCDGTGGRAGLFGLALLLPWLRRRR